MPTDKNLPKEKSFAICNNMDLESIILSTIRQRQLLYVNCENLKNMWNQKNIFQWMKQTRENRFTGVKNKLVVNKLVRKWMFRGAK